MDSVQIIVSLLAGLSVIAVGGAVLMIKWASRAPLDARLRQIAGNRMIDEPASTFGPRFAGMVENIGTAVAPGKASVSLREQLTQAGYHGESTASVYVGAKLILAVVGLLGSAAVVVPSDAFLIQTKSVIVMLCAMGAFFIPNIIVASRRASRRGEIRKHLPDAIDLLEICASAGMGIDMAWNSVGDEVRAVSMTLADEMALTNLEIHLGAPRAEAMRHMASRTGADELSSLVAVLVQSERFGTSIIDALRTYATSMRETRSQRAQEAAEKMAIKLIFPMIAFIFPAAVLVMAGPAFMSLYQVLAH
ncbi:MAG TPA: type II secretion system F family protein [Tepidisphaeraceae bacterium]|jgi:tight adherence protein C